ncbi:MAG: ParB/RepB/Spo0J family partition protein [Gemmatimonadota bacterium]|nr:ParB/RepB/Spo0J family partition protein [Gemmatimonadota bacterium]
MSREDRRLGKGLAALLGENLEEESAAPDHEVPLDRIEPNPFQPRGAMDEAALEELAASIRANGLLQPLVVRPVGDGYQIVAGERRYRALERLGRDRAAVVVRTLSDEQMLVLALVENLQRENLSPLEEAGGYQRLIDEFDLTQEEVGRHVGRDRSTIANALRLLGLPDGVRTLLEDGSLSAGHARALLGLDDVDRQAELARRAVAEGWSVRETERRVKERRKPASRSSRTSTGAKPASRDPVARRAELILERRLGTQVRVLPRPDGGGELRVTFHDADDFSRLVELVGGEGAARELEG